MARIDPKPVLEDFEELLEKLDEIMEKDEGSMAFYEDIKEKAQDMVRWITENNVATDNHQRAADNWTELIEEKLDGLS